MTSFSAGWPSGGAMSSRDEWMAWSTIIFCATGDSGFGARLGDYKGHATGIGPQIGFFFPAGEGYTGYLNVRGYADIVTENRAKSTTFMVTLGLAPSAPEQPATPRGPKHLK